ncbi:hypothetical protein V6N13_109290 [Hibiscus sabdariffa]|uniref:Uncharacterized protein n=1 Tax=Hibiscus sabdariffa TaxID=183260 RepID=A0ABR2FP56_9ROSI
MTLEGSDNNDRGPNGLLALMQVVMMGHVLILDDRNEDCGLGSIDANEAGSDENLDNLGKKTGVDSAVENEVEQKGLSSGDDTDYLDSSDFGSYKTDSYGDFISKKTAKAIVEVENRETWA